MTTRSNLKEIEPVDVDERDTRDITEGLGDTIVLVVDDDGATALDAAPVPHLTLASSEATRSLHLERESKN